MGGSVEVAVFVFQDKSKQIRCLRSGKQYDFSFKMCKSKGGVRSMDRGTDSSLKEEAEMK